MEKTIRLQCHCHVVRRDEDDAMSFKVEGQRK